jgi:serine/threonine protein kinase
MHELRSVCERLHGRLSTLLGELELQECKGQHSSDASLNSLTDAVAKFLQFLEKNNGKGLVYRVVKHKAMTDELQQLNDEVSELLFDLLEVAAVDQREEERLLLDTLLATSIEDDRSLQSHRSQLVALLTLKWELERENHHDEEGIARMKSLMETVRSASDLKVEFLPPWFLPEYELNYEPQPFASGTFGSVHRCVWSSGVKAVVKRLRVDGMAIDRRTARMMEKEVNSHFQMDHANVVKMLGASHVSSPPFLVYEDAIHGDLGSYLSSSDENKQHIWTLLYQAALGLAYLHEKGVVHGHLRLSNIVVGADGQAKLSDFGLTTTRLVSAKGGGNSSDLRWRAPECLSRRPTFASDVHSFAMCMIEAATGELPFAYLTDYDVRENVKSGTIPDQPDEMSDRVWELVVSMTTVEPAERVGLAQVIDALETLSRSELPSNPPAGSSHCSVCSSLVVDLSRCCAQCGNRAFVKEERSPTCDSPVNFSPASISVEMNGDTSVSELLRVIRQGGPMRKKMQCCFCFKLAFKTPNVDSCTQTTAFPIWFTW